MRNKLKPLMDQRLRFTATIERYGKKHAYRGEPLKTILLTDVRLEGNDTVLTDHIWFTCGKSWEQCNIGDTIAFDARVTQYIKGYQGYRDDIYDRPTELDYRLERPTKITIMDNV
ncbi:hypothetical protein [Shewanella sp. SE1]|uniref:hypothetical protein n=1 Tax=Shewanella sp. SE1 TaxID=2705014 RepID=UPI00138EE05D|nr:hypothetical protein [Shewanella sp. SE1]NDO73052.1 hypothetical protein [Shewanella sp. SE1]